MFAKRQRTSLLADGSYQNILCASVLFAIYACLQIRQRQTIFADGSIQQYKLPDHIPADRHFQYKFP